MEIPTPSIVDLAELTGSPHLDGDLLLFDKLTDFPLPVGAGRTSNIVVALCLEGNSTYMANTVEHRVGPDDVLIIHDGQVVDGYRIDPAQRSIGLIMSPDFFHEVLKDIHELASLIIFSRSHPVFRLTPHETENMIEYFVKKVHNRNSFVSPQIVICIPRGATAVERRAIQESAEGAGARRVFLIEEPMAAAIGAGLPVTEPTGSMIVDIGGGTTEVAVISLGGIVVSHSLRIAGDELDEDIVNYIKREMNLAIGETTGEQIKMQIGCAMPLMTEMSMEVRGRDLSDGLPRNVTVTSTQIEEAMKESISKIVEIVKLTLEKTPPELSSDIMEKGIVLAGGGALIKNLDKLLSIETGMPVYIAEEPLDCVVRGTGKTLEDLERLKTVLINARRKK